MGTARDEYRTAESGGKALLVLAWVLIMGELAQVPHYPETRVSQGGYLYRT